MNGGGEMDINWRELIWEGRWTAIEMLSNAVVINITTHWCFGPLLLVILSLPDGRNSPGSVRRLRRANVHAHSGR
jgi:hypothetical protein